MLPLQDLEKTTIVKNLISDKFLNLGFSVQQPQEKKEKNEIDGKDYYFLSKGEFKEKINLMNLLNGKKYTITLFMVL